MMVQQLHNRYAVNAMGPVLDDAANEPDGDRRAPSTPVKTAEAGIDQLDLFGELPAVAGIETTYEIVNAPMAELGKKGVPRSLRKPNAAVHVYPLRGKYSLVMRRLFNALLALGHEKVKTMPEGTVAGLMREQKVMRFEASVADIKELIGQSNVGDYEGLYEALDALVSLRVVWDVLAADGGRWSNTAGLLSQWGRNPDTNKISWAWMPDLFDMLFDRDNPYTPLDLELARKFNSKYTLALYENCFRYRSTGHTPLRPIRDWVLLIAGPDLYQEYREFKRQVLAKAMLEMANTPSCAITVSLIEEHAPRKLNNKVDGLQFRVQFKAQQPLDLGPMSPTTQALHNKLKKLGVADAALKTLLVQEDPMFLERMLEMTLREHAKGRVKNPAAWFVSAVQKRFEDELQLHEEAVEKSLEAGRKKEAKALADKAALENKTGRAMKWLDSQSKDEQKYLEARFIAATNKITRARYEKDGFASKMVEASFRVWLCQWVEGLGAGVGVGGEIGDKGVGAESLVEGEARGALRPGSGMEGGNGEPGVGDQDVDGAAGDARRLTETPGATGGGSDAGSGVGVDIANKGDAR